MPIAYSVVGYYGGNERDVFLFYKEGDKLAQRIYWDINDPKSYNALYYFIIGERGDGKTYGCKVDCIEDFIDNGHEFVYVRRFDTEMKKAKSEFVNDIIEKYKDHEFKVDGDKLFIDGRICGYFIILSKAKLYKSVPFPKVRTIIFDEFLLKKGHHRYLYNEVDSFLDLYETVNRTVMRELEGIPHTRVWFLANAVSVTNPYFMYFDLELPITKNKIKRHSKSKDIVIQLVQSEAFRKMAERSRVGQMLGHTDFFKHAFGNEFSYDKKNFVLPLPKDKQYLFTLKAAGRPYGVWRDRETGFYHVSEKYDPSCKFVYAMLLENHEPNTILLSGSRRNFLVKNFISVFKSGGVFYDNVNIQNIISEIMKGMVR